MGTLLLINSLHIFDMLPSFSAAVSELTGDSVHLCYKKCILNSKIYLFVALVVSLLFSVNLLA